MTKDEAIKTIKGVIVTLGDQKIPVSDFNTTVYIKACIDNLNNIISEGIEDDGDHDKQGKNVPGQLGVGAGQAEKAKNRP